MQRERSEVVHPSLMFVLSFSFLISLKVAFHIFTNGTKTLGLNLTQRFKITDEGELDTENKFNHVGEEKKASKELMKLKLSCIILTM